MTVINETREVRPRHSPWMWLALVLALALLIVPLVIYLTRDDDTDATDDPPSSADGPTAAFASSTTEVAGEPRGFPDTEAGAVEASIAIMSQNIGGAIYDTDAEIQEWAQDVYSDPEEALVPGAFDELRESLGVAPDLTYTGPQGWRAYADCLPELGAYKATPGGADVFTVEVWMPCFLGQAPADKPEGLNILWARAGLAVVFRDGDWRTATGATVEYEDETPVPADKNDPVTTLTERLELLGPDWKLLADASEAWPTELLGEEPSR